ncbi:MAG TPA: hypothetical protein VIV60_29625 [Polyangiaceae bacterium]
MNRYEAFARKVCNAMLAIRGYRNPSEAPMAVVNDVFATMLRHERRYEAGLTFNEDPKHTAQDIQDAEWDRDRED